MLESYCGKQCNSCPDRRAFRCNGCKNNQGMCDNECVLAQCCKEKGYNACDDCSLKDSCNIWRDRYMLSVCKTEKTGNDFARKWIWYLFFLWFVRLIANYFTRDFVTDWMSEARIFGELLTVISSITYGLVFLRLSRESKHYRIAAICHFIIPFVSSELLLLLGDITIGVIITILNFIVTLLSEYKECQGHAEILLPVDAELAQKWKTFWKLEIIVYLLLLFVLLGANVLMEWGMLLMVSIAVVVSVLKVVYLYRTAKAL